jgi:hypothetical protein
MNMAKLLDAATIRVDEKDLPVIIQSQVEKLNELSKSVDKALRAADKASKSAMNAKNKSAGLFHKKEAIEELQLAGADAADAIISNVEAQKISFEFHSSLAETSKYLLGLGLMNIVNNRTVIRQLELKLKNASKKELSELARQEILNVITQLKAQEDIMSKQAAHSKIIKGHDIKLEFLSQKDQERDEQFKALSRKDKERDEQLKSQLKMEERHDKELRERKKKDMEQDAFLVSLQKASQEMLERIETQKIEIEQLTDKLKNLGILLESKAEKLFVIVSLIIFSIVLVGGIVLFLAK